MKRIHRFKEATSIIIIFSFILACSKEGHDNSLNSTIPPAQASNNSKSGGIYKGAIVGSTGNLAIVLQDGVNKIYVTLDGRDYTLTTQASIISGTAITGATFTGSGISMTFSVDANGDNPSISALLIPNHPDAVASVLKETSTATVMVFEGRYTKTSGSANDHCSGTINFIINGSLFKAFYKEDVLGNPTSAGTFSGAYSGSQINTTVGSAVVAVTISSNMQNIAGTITGACSSSANCTRTL